MTCNIFMDLPNGTKMPGIGLGTWQATDEQELEKSLNVALEVGYRHIDTALVYKNENIIGRVLKKWFDSGKLKREDIFLTTKLPMYAVRAESVEEHMKMSLENLGLEYVDLYLIHFPVCIKARPSSGEEEIEHEVTDHLAVWKKMEEQVKAGRAKSIGLSNFNKRQVKRILDSFPKIKPANLQVELHVYLQQQELVKFCQENGVTVSAYCPLGSPGFNKFLAGMGLPPRDLPDMLNDSTIQSIGKKHGKTNAQIMLRYLLERNIIVLPKSVTEKRIKENFDIFNFTLDSTDMETLNKLEVGEKARIGDFKLFKGTLEQNEEFPF